MKLGNWTPQVRNNWSNVLTTLAALAALICCCNSVIAAEVYTWKDQNGITHFSEVPPETGQSELIDVEEAYLPGSTGAYPESEISDESATSETDDFFTESGDEIAQQRREELATDRKARQEAKAETAKLCQQNKDLLARLEPARRVMYVNEQGEEVRMDDGQRVSLIEETKAFVDKNCK